MAEIKNLETHELNPAAFWSHLLNEKVFPHFKKEISELEIMEDANKFSFTLRRSPFYIKFEWDGNKFFTATILEADKEISINGYSKRDVRLDALLNGRDGSDFQQIIDFLMKGNINLSAPLFFKKG